MPNNQEEAPTITLTDANYGNDLVIVTAHITACTIVSETTYREGHIPEGVFRRTLIYTIGGNQLQVRETPEEVIQKMKAAE